MPSSKMSVEIDFLRKLISYDAETGRLVWRSRTPDMFEDKGLTAEHACAQWNGKFAGADIVAEGERYARASIFGRRYYAHRIAWALQTGRWPESEVDHINGDKRDNQFRNLRVVSTLENARNVPVRRRSCSGMHGVRWKASINRWIAFIGVDGRSIHLGNFMDKDSAVAARRAAEARHGFHENHGRPVV